MMETIGSDALQYLWYNLDQRETQLRTIINESLQEDPPPTSEDYIIASYFFAFRTQSLAHAVTEISYHATSGIKNPPDGSLLDGIPPQKYIHELTALAKSGKLKSLLSALHQHYANELRPA
jgi:hypothetical protein